MTHRWINSDPSTFQLADIPPWPFPDCGGAFPPLRRRSMSLHKPAGTRSRGRAAAAEAMRTRVVARLVARRQLRGGDADTRRLSARARPGSNERSNRGPRSDGVHGHSARAHMGCGRVYLNCPDQQVASHAIESAAKYDGAVTSKCNTVTAPSAPASSQEKHLAESAHGGNPPTNKSPPWPNSPPTPQPPPSRCCPRSRKTDISAARGPGPPSLLENA